MVVNSKNLIDTTLENPYFHPVRIEIHGTGAFDEALNQTVKADFEYPEINIEERTLSRFPKSQV